MTEIPYRIALIAGAGSGISASFARGLAAAGLRVGLAARNVDKLTCLADETGAQTFTADASDPAAVARLFEKADERIGEPDVVLYNASARAHGPIAEINPEALRKAVEISAFGAFLVVQRAARRMIPHGRGAILLSGASAASRATRSRRLSPWANSHCAGWRKARRASSGRRASTSHFVIDGGDLLTDFQGDRFCNGDVRQQR